jgi:hypothetical protein
MLRQPSPIACAIVTTLVTAFIATSAAAQTTLQIIIVDGVKYQAVSTAVPAPYALPVQAATPAPVLVAPVAFPAVPAPIATAPAYDAHTVQAVHSSANVVVPLVVTAIGVWALSQWFKPEHREYRHHPHHPRPASVYTPAPPVWLPPVQGGHYPR